jgi:histidine ammonia-lyase
MIELNGHTLTIPALWSVSQGETTCLPARARRRMRQSRALVEKLAAQPRAIYGINTGFGPLSGTRVSPDDLAQHQLNLLHHLSVGQG